VGDCTGAYDSEFVKSGGSIFTKRNKANLRLQFKPMVPWTADGISDIRNDVAPLLSIPIDGLSPYVLSNASAVTNIGKSTGETVITFKPV
jgi:hypothetical protein